MYILLDVHFRLYVEAYTCKAINVSKFYFYKPLAKFLANIIKYLLLEVPLGVMLSSAFVVVVNDVLAAVP